VTAAVSYFDYARLILQGSTLEDKLFDAPIVWDEFRNFDLPKLPSRSGSIKFSDDRSKFPKVPQLHLPEKKAMALHSFGNHELLALEMMAAALLIYPHKTDEDIRFKKGIVSALKDEQKHLKLYIQRINELGFQFGDFSLNDFFWRQMEKLKSPAQYTALMSVTFEAANLDFAQYYGKIFRSLGDDVTADLMNVVLEDEISHVAFGAHWLKRWRSDQTLWEYYRSSLPHPLTPARSRGLDFDPGLHMKAMGDVDFLEHLIAYDDDFLVTKRAK
jgi:ferritin-like protein